MPSSIINSPLGAPPVSAIRGTSVGVGIEVGDAGMGSELSLEAGLGVTVASGGTGGRVAVGSA
jgi:hypothetical protein